MIAESINKSSNENRSSDRLGELLKNRDRKISGDFYSRVIRTLRIFLPLMALGIMAIIIVLSQSEEDFTRERESFTLDKPATNELTKPRFESRDAKDQPYTITANKAIQSETQKDKIFLDKPMADMTTTSGSWVAVEADQGEYTENREKLLLKGNVHLFQDDGYSLRTTEMQIDLNERKAESDKDVEAHGPAGTLKAKGLTALEKENKIIFKGPATLTLHNKNDKKLLPQ